MIGFEAPLALLGIALLVVPLALHLFVRRAPPVVALPTTRFLDALPRPRRRLSPPRDRLVLAARLLGLGALILAAARPFAARSPGAAPGPAPLVLVLDDTLSMGHGHPSRLTRAKAALLARLDALAPGARAALLLTSKPRAPLEDRAVVRTQLEGVAPRPCTGSLVAPLEAAAELAREAPLARIVVASDFDRASLAGLERRSSAARALTPELVDVGQDTPHNAWLSSVELAPSTPVAGFPLEVRARISTEGLEPTTEIPVALELPGGERQERQARPGERVSFRIARAGPGLFEAQLHVSAPGDALALDDRVAVGAVVLPRLDVVVASDDPAASEPLARALGAVARARGAALAISLATPSELAHALENAHVLFLGAQASLDRSALDAVARFVGRGGGLVALLDEHSREPAGSAHPWLPAVVHPRAPTTALALRPDETRLEPELARGLEALALAPQAELEPDSGATVVLRDASGAALWVERGRVALLALSPTGRNEALASETVFPLLVRRALGAALGAWATSSVEVGESLSPSDLEHAAGIAPAVASAARLRSPSGEERPLLGAPLVLGTPGVWRVLSSSGADLACVAARVPEVESRLERGSPGALAPDVSAVARAQDAERDDRSLGFAGVGLALLALAAMGSSLGGESAETNVQRRGAEARGGDAESPRSPGAVPPRVSMPRRFNTSSTSAGEA